MNTEKAATELKAIRQLMERPIRFSSMSGLAAIQAGGWASLGLAADWLIFGALSGAKEAMLAGVAVWAGVFVLSLLGVLVLTRRRERQQGMPSWSPVKRRILATILPPFVAAVGVTTIIGLRYIHAETTGAASAELTWLVGPGQLIPAIWMLFYGVTLWQLGQFSPIDVKVLGLAFIAAGLVTASLWQGHWYWTMGVAFGGSHLVYGVIVCIRHGG